MTTVMADAFARAESARKRKTKKADEEPAFIIVNEHVRRTYREINKTNLTIPIDQYQRDESQGRLASEIAMCFDIVAFNTLTVIERSNGDLVVADGGTRLSAARRRSDITKVPCMVYSGLTDKQEADSFLRINLDRRRLKTEQQHHAEVYSEQELALVVQGWLDAMKDAKIEFVGLRTIRGCAKTQIKATRTIVDLLLFVAVDKQVTSKVMKGLVRLETVLNKTDRSLSQGRTVKRLQHEFGNLEVAVSAVIKPRTSGNVNEFAKAIAKRLGIRMSTET